MDIKARYRSGEDNLGRDFFARLLSQATSYDRAAGYFSSGALNAWAGAVPGLAARRGHIRLLLAPELSVEDRTSLLQAVKLSEEARAMTEDAIAHRLVAAATAMHSNGNSCEHRSQLLTWLIASGLLEIRFAWFQGTQGEELYHEKFGVITLLNGNKVSFGGSANETAGGHERNGERIDVFCSWKPGELERISSHAQDFESSWNGNGHIRVRRLTDETLELIRAIAPKSAPALADASPLTAHTLDAKWRHQDEAVCAFLSAKRGILEMATGTGKTRTAIRAMSALREDGSIVAAIVCTDGNDLLDQWHKELLPWATKGGWRCEQFYGPHHSGSMFGTLHEKSVLVTNRRHLASIVRRLQPSAKARIMLIHDEVHGLGEPSSQINLRGQHSPFAYTLGLSATPQREYDPEGSSFIQDEIGDVIYQFGLRDAIERGILVPFDYCVLPFTLSADDKERIQRVYAQKAARAQSGNPMSREQVWIELARVYKTASEKIPKLAEFLMKRPDTLDRCIIFAETTEHVAPLFEIIHGLGKRFSQYFADDGSELLHRFANGELDCLVTCHKLSQGIDVPDLRTVILVASSRAMLETIQRLGRCLRANPADPKKRALVVDFMRSDTNSPEESRATADAARVAWLTELASIRGPS
jgi:superfamily II DNA or RNA helicase